MRDDLSIIKFLESLHNRLNDDDDSSFDNTVIQFFEAPHDNATLTALILAYVNGANIPMTANDIATLTALINAQVTDPATLTWGGYDGSNVYWNAGWAWGYGGTWKGYKTALSFNGVSNKVTAGSFTVPLTTTIEGWIKVTSATAQRCFFSNRLTADGLYIGHSAGLFFVYSGTSGIGSTMSSAGSSIPLNQWVHLAFTSDGTTGTMYINGIQVKQQALARSASTGAVNIGWDSPNADFFSGSVDDVRIWSVTRTQAQIQDNMNGQLVGNETGLAGYWKFDEGRGLMAYDATTNHNDGTLVNGPTWITY